MDISAPGIERAHEGSASSCEPVSRLAFAILRTDPFIMPPMPDKVCGAAS
jgi:hypothetical protein